MPNARRPSGPTKPVHLEREDANEREQIEDALCGHEMTDGHHADKPSRHNPASPQAGNQDLPANRPTSDRNARSERSDAASGDRSEGRSGPRSEP